MRMWKNHTARFILLSLLYFAHCFLNGLAFPSKPWGHRRHGRHGLHSRATTLSPVIRSKDDKPDTSSDDSCCSFYETDDFDAVKQYTREALQERGNARGLQALQTLGSWCAARRPYDFSASSSAPNVGQSASCGGERVIEKMSNLIPPAVTQRIFAKVQSMQERGLLSTNPDSVDGLPSFHLNLISGGRAMVAVEDDATADCDSTTTTLPLDDGFEKDIRDLTHIVTPYVYEQLLPRVQQVMNSTDICVNDVFLRRYGPDVMHGQSRHGISAHYDVYSYATAVIALDNVACEGRNGLYTTQISPGTTGRTSNHASLRRYFPLACGDAVIHSWDVLHGVHVEPGLDRTSLIVWFTTITNTNTSTPEEEEEEPAKDGGVASWLSQRSDLHENDVAQFVLASALESSSSSSISSNSDFTSANDEGNIDPKCVQSLYLNSAFRENTFALTRMGAFCENDELDSELRHRAVELLDTLASVESVPDVVLGTGEKSSPLTLAKRFWWEGAIRGNPNAQMALADELMVEITTAAAKDHVSNDKLLLAGVLFALAAQQGDERAMESLKRLVQLDLTWRRRREHGNNDDDDDATEDFSNLPLVQVVNAAFACM